MTTVNLITNEQKVPSTTLGSIDNYTFFTGYISGFAGLFYKHSKGYFLIAGMDKPMSWTFDDTGGSWNLKEVKDYRPAKEVEITVKS